MGLTTHMDGAAAAGTVGRDESRAGQVDVMGQQDHLAAMTLRAPTVCIDGALDIDGGLAVQLNVGIGDIPARRQRTLLEPVVLPDTASGEPGGGGNDLAGAKHFNAIGIGQQEARARLHHTADPGGVRTGNHVEDRLVAIALDPKALPRLNAEILPTHQAPIRRHPDGRIGPRNNSLNVDGTTAGIDGQGPGGLTLHQEGENREGGAGDGAGAGQFPPGRARGDVHSHFRRPTQTRASGFRPSTSRPFSRALFCPKGQATSMETL